MGKNFQNEARLKAFSYVVADKAAQYRAVMGAFVEAKTRFSLHLRPADILASVEPDTLLEPLDEPSLGPLLEQLCEWGNLQPFQDTADVATVEEFYRPRFIYQLTAEGEGAERAIGVYWDIIHKPGELQAAALGDIRDLLHQVLELAAAETPDESKVHLTLRNLRHRFEELTSQAQAFMGSLQRTIDLQGIDLDAFLAYKQTLIDYLERFLGQLVLATVEISDLLERVEQQGVDRLLEAAARRDLIDSLTVTDDDRQEALAGWRARWDGLRAWFIHRPGAASQAEVLRARARAAIPALLTAVAAIHDRRVQRSDRVADLQTLARWFAQAETDGAAHRLWRAAFGLAPARHLRIDAETLAQRDQEPVSAKTSWLAAPPLRIADFSGGKSQLSDLARREAEQAAAARQRIATGRPVRLSELGELNPDEFRLFLHLLGEALARQTHPGETVEAQSADGALRIQLTPCDDGLTAAIVTPEGTFLGRDHVVAIADTHAPAATGG
ncbi:MAG: TIGR02677 family protein [Thermoguttaceae bacterium]